MTKLTDRVKIEEITEGVMVRRTILRYRLILLGIATAIMVPILMTVAHPNNTAPEVPVLGAYGEATSEAEEDVEEAVAETQEDLESELEESVDFSSSEAASSDVASASYVGSASAQKAETRTITITKNGYATDNEEAPETAAIAPVGVEAEGAAPAAPEAPAEDEGVGEEIGE